MTLFLDISYLRPWLLFIDPQGKFSYTPSWKKELLITSLDVAEGLPEGARNS